MTSILNTAIGYLSERCLSQHQLIAQLEKDFFSHPELDKSIGSVINRLNELNLFRDDYLAKSLAVSYSHKGNRFIKRFLEQKGISSYLIEKALDSLEDETLRALEEVRQHLRLNPRKSLEELYRFLSGRGFTIKAINQALKKFHLKQRSIPFNKVA